MKRILLQIGMAIPVYIVALAAIGADLNWYEQISLWCCASMASGMWLNSVGA